MQPELRQLRAFLAVADQGSANRARIALLMEEIARRLPAVLAAADW